MMNSLLNFARLLHRFESIGLDGLDAVALPDRIDIKYVLTAQQLYGVLPSLAGHYWVLDIDGVRLNRYQTLYFDTADFRLYLRHHAGRRTRYKVRSRQYVDTSCSFLEVKLKTNKNRTLKSRISTPEFVTRLTPETDDFMQACYPFDAQCLEPKLRNDFLRVTLVGTCLQERLTLDLGLRFGYDGCSAALPGIAVAEVKQVDLNRDSAFIRCMRAAGVHPTGFSKYCIGVSMLCRDVKHNNFKPKLRLVHKLMRGDDNGRPTH
jgi:hypothetical protein